MAQIVESISELAARWAVRADAGQLDPDEERELEAWLNADPRHHGAYVRARAQWVDLDRLAVLNGPVTSDSPLDSALDSAGTTPSKEHGALQHATLGGVSASNSSRSASSFSRRQLLAASVAALAITGGGLSWLILHDSREHYASDIGEVRRIALADGSTVTLNTNTEVAVRLEKEQRDIELIRGEALFEVAHDKTRPFIVMANATAVRAVGTAFAVRLDHSQVDVTVTEGVVEVSDRSASGAGPMAPTAAQPAVRRVKAHERVVIMATQNSTPEIESIAIAASDRQLAWREGMVSFDGETLQTAVAEINRHNRRQIVIDDPLLAQKPVVGVFRATDLDGFSGAAAIALKARAVPDGEVIRLEAATSR